MTAYNWLIANAFCRRLLYRKYRLRPTLSQWSVNVLLRMRRRNDVRRNRVHAEYGHQYFKMKYTST